MDESIKFSREELKTYFLTGFPFGKDFAPAFEGAQLVNCERNGGVFGQMDHQGAPTLRDDFTEHMDATSYGLRITYQRVREVVDGMRRINPVTNHDHTMNHWHATLYWWAIQRNQGVKQASFAERIGVDERTVRRWLHGALGYVELMLTAPFEEVFILPAEPVMMMRAA